MADHDSWFYWRDKQLFVYVYAQPRASNNHISGIHDHHLKIHLTTPPVDGRANKDLVAFLAKQFKVPKNRVVLVKGEASRKKLFRIDEPADISLTEKYT